MDFEFKEHYNVNDLVEIVKKLRAPDGCPWDKVQTHKTIRSDFIEEVYEAVEAIDEDVADDVCQKMILRHPHVFGNVKADTPDEVLKNWDQIKMQSKSQESASEAMKSVSKTLPSLMRSEKLWKKAERGGAAIESTEQAFELVQKELDELKALADENKTDNYGSKLGELLFSIAGLSRFLKTDCERSLYDACDNFIARFQRLETVAEEKGIDIQKCCYEEPDGFLNAISNSEK